ncbi:MAG TPA: hypothetical protein VFW11_10800 [Cyclobacteriaceae bacterium]|nr:hypothetical protein [Cyclobacteriaceae bacterium]
MRKLLVIAACLFFASCSDDPTPDFSRADYFPNTPGSSWSYQGVFSVLMTVTGETVKLDGKNYVKISSDTSTPTYLFKKNGEYYLRGFVQGATDQNLLVLKDNVGTGSRWNQQIKINKLDNAFDYTLMEKNTRETVNGITYSDVIVVKMEQSIKYGHEMLPVCEMVFHFAKGVGLVKMETQYDNLTGLDVLNGSTELEYYSVN